MRHSKDKWTISSSKENLHGSWKAYISKPRQQVVQIMDKCQTNLGNIVE